LEWRGLHPERDNTQVVRDYEGYKHVYKPALVDSRTIATGESEDEFSMLLVNKAAIGKTALDGDFRSSYFRVDDQRWYSIAETMRIQEIAGYGTVTSARYRRTKARPDLEDLQHHAL
jgi:hypothetical protein